MQKLILFIFLSYFSIFLSAEDLILQPKCFVKLKIKDYSGYDYALNRSNYNRNDYYLICENKNKENVALRLREIQKELPRYQHNINPSINIIMDKTVYLYIYSGNTKLYKITNYERDTVSLIYNTWYKISLKTKKIQDDNIIEINNQMSKKDYILLKDNFKISNIIDCYAKDDFIFTLITPESHERIDKKEFNVNLN